jgi:SAM-dependent methyltransferase
LKEDAVNTYHDANRRRWEEGAAAWAEHADRRGLWRRCVKEPALVLEERERYWLGDVRDQAVCVLGSGDNQVVFALAGMGARVTSVDISEKQLEVARGRAAELGLSVTFMRADVTDLSVLADEAFDVVYTGGHVAVWVSDLRTYYAEAARILKAGGLFLVSEYHPFRRLWRDSKERLELNSGYFDRGPHACLCAEDVLYPQPGEHMTYEFNWTIGDYIDAVMATGCELQAVEEFGDKSEAWECSPLQGLPRVLLIVTLKRMQS